MAALSSCLSTKLRNISTKTLSFSFIPPHGKRLASGEEVTIDGDVLDRIVRRKRYADALNNALTSGLLAIVESPPAYVYDSVLDYTKYLGIDSGAVVLNDPCTGAYSSSETVIGQGEGKVQDN